MDWENPEQVLRALVYLYGQQTAEERITGMTIHDNGVGFNAVDAPFLTKIALDIVDEEKEVSTNQYQIVKSCMVKYKGQLADVDLSRVYFPITGIPYQSREKQPEHEGTLSTGEKDGKKVLLFEPNVFPTKHIKEAGPFHWDSPYWVGVLSPGIIRRVLEIFPTAEKAQDLLDWEQSLEEIPEIDEELANSDLFAFQKEAVGFIKRSKRSLLGLSPGLGKSVVAIYAARGLGGKTLIISPLSLVRNWQKEINKWTGDQSQIWHGRLGVTNTDWVITNYESILGLWIDYDIKTTTNKNGRTIKQRVNWECIVEHDFDNLIVDESIMVKNRKAQRTKAVEAVARTFDRVWLLSGAPTSKYYDDLWSQLNILDPKRFSSYWKFTEEYCHIEKGYWGWKITGNRSNSSTNIKEDLRDIYFSRTQDQVLDLPDWVFDNVDIDMGAEQYKAYYQMEEEFKAELPEGDVIVARNLLSQMTRLIQFASNPVLVGGYDQSNKWDAITEILEYERLPAIIWTSFVHTAEKLENKLNGKKYRVRSLTGNTPTDMRQYIVDEFQNDNIDIIVAHPGVGKFGFTLTAARTAIYLERSYNGDDYFQSLHRVRRIGTTESPHVIHLRSTRPNGGNTIDHVIHQALDYKTMSTINLTSGIIREVLSIDD